MNDSTFDSTPKRRVVLVMLRIIMSTGDVIMYRHTDKERASRIIAQISDRMHACFRDPTEDPFIDSVRMIDDVVAVPPSASANNAEGGKSNLAMVKSERTTTVVDVRKIVSVSLVCPGCHVVVLDNLPGHIVKEGLCEDPLCDGHDVKVN